VKQARDLIERQRANAAEVEDSLSLVIANLERFEASIPKVYAECMTGIQIGLMRFTKVVEGGALSPEAQQQTAALMREMRCRLRDISGIIKSHGAMTMAVMDRYPGIEFDLEPAPWPEDLPRLEECDASWVDADDIEAPSP
jgi:hypothetical protein